MRLSKNFEGRLIWHFLGLGHLVVLAETPSFPKQSINETNLALESKSLEQETAYQSKLSLVSSTSSVEPSEPEENLKDFRYSELHYIGKIFGTYLLCSHQNKLYLVDMHAAHERYNYNLLRQSFKNTKISSQLLLVPETIELSESEVLNLDHNMEMLLQFGFEVEIFGQTSVIIRAVPDFLDLGALKILISELAALEYPSSGLDRLSEEIEIIAAKIACHSSLRSGDEIGVKEVYALFDQLDQTEFSAACPHGRPVAISFSEAEIEKMVW